MNLYIVLVCVILIFVVEIFRLRRRLRKLSFSLRNTERHLKSRIQKDTASQAQFDTVLSSMFEGILLTNRLGEIVFMNPSLRKMFLLDGSLEGKRPIEVIRNKGIQEMVDKILEGSKGLITQEIVLTLPEEKFLKVNAVPLLKEHQVEGVTLVFHDITELRHLESIRQDFVANVSHELRTPVASIRGYAETLLDGAIADEEHVKKFIEIIHQDSERLSELIDDLLDLARIESGKMKMVLLPINLSNVVQKTISILNPQIKNKHLTVSSKLSSDIPKVLADEARISQVILNLLDNAVKYTPEGGQIVVDAVKSNHYVQMDIIDSGIGIPEKDLLRVFERFYRVDKARSREMGGTGLGLSIVKHIVQAHNGRVWVDSELGKGSTFHFTLPRVN